MAGVPIFSGQWLPLAGSASGSTTAITVTWPTGHATNDVAFLVIETANEDATLTTANGFAQVTQTGVGSAAATGATRLEVWWCRATSTAQPSPVVGDPGNHVIAKMFTVSNVTATGTPFVVLAAATAATGTSVTLPSVTTTGHNQLVLYIITAPTSGAGPDFQGWSGGSPLTDLTERFDAGVTSGNGGMVAALTGAMETAGVVAAITGTALTSYPHSYAIVAVDGLGAVTGSGAMSLASPAMAGTGSVTAPPVTGTGAMSFAPALAGTGQQQHTGTGAVSLTNPALSGTGQQQHTGSGAISLASPALAGTGQQANTGTGAMSLASPAMDGSGTVTGGAPPPITGTGAMSFAPALAGTGQQAHSGSGAVSLTNPALAGTGGQAQSGSGAISFAPALAGTGSQAIAGSGAISFAPALSGSGAVSGAPTTGSGAISFAPVLAGTGTVTAPAITGSGAMSLAVPALAGAGQQQNTGTGAVTLAVPTLAGTGTNTQQVTGTGSQTVTLVLAGTGTRGIVGTGDLAITLVYGITGAVVNPSTHFGKYKPEWTSALADVGQVSDFAVEHASALADLMDAGV